MIRIFIESGVSAARSKGKKTTNEQDFVEKIIAHYFPEAVVSKDFEVVGVDGWTNIANQSYDFKQNTDESGTNLVVFDADEDRNGGGFEKRKASLEDFKKKAGIEFDLFLWPDNKGDGDFELLLSKVINAKHQCLLDCYDEFEKKVRQHDPKEEKYVTPGRKGKMYTYETGILKARNLNLLWNFLPHILIVTGSNKNSGVGTVMFILLISFRTLSIIHLPSSI